MMSCVESWLPTNDARICWILSFLKPRDSSARRASRTFVCESAMKNPSSSMRKSPALFGPIFGLLCCHVGVQGIR